MPGPRSIPDLVHYQIVRETMDEMDSDSKLMSCIPVTTKYVLSLSLSGAPSVLSPAVIDNNVKTHLMHLFTHGRSSKIGVDAQLSRMGVVLGTRQMDLVNVKATLHHPDHPKSKCVVSNHHELNQTTITDNRGSPKFKCCIHSSPHTTKAKEKYTLHSHLLDDLSMMYLVILLDATSMVSTTASNVEIETYSIQLRFDGSTLSEILQNNAIIRKSSMDKSSLSDDARKIYEDRPIYRKTVFETAVLPTIVQEYFNQDKRDTFDPKPYVDMVLQYAKLKRESIAFGLISVSDHDLTQTLIDTFMSNVARKDRGLVHETSHGYLNLELTHLVPVIHPFDPYVERMITSTRSMLHIPAPRYVASSDVVTDQ